VELDGNGGGNGHGIGNGADGNGNGARGNGNGHANANGHANGHGNGNGNGHTAALGPREIDEQTPWLRSLARRVSIDGSRADDLVQETWVAALRSATPESTRTRSWLASAVRNFARSEARSERRRRSREERYARLSASAGERVALPSPDESAERLELLNAVTEELRALDDPYRNVIRLRYAEGLEPTEIARRYGMAAGTVRWRLHRALEELRRRLTDRLAERETRRPARRTTTGIGGLVAALLLPLWRRARRAEPTYASVAACAVVGLGALVAVRWDAAEALLGGGAERAPLTARPGAPATDGRRAYVPVREGAGSVRPVAPTAPQRASAHVDASARVVDALGAPLAGARLVLVEPRLDAAGSGGSTGTERSADPVSGANGRVRLRLARARFGDCEELAFRVEREGYVPRRLAARVPAGGALELGDVALVRPGVLEGLVRDLAGEPVEGARVVVVAGGSRLERDELTILYGPPSALQKRAARTDRTGRFAFGDLDDGTWQVWAGAPGREWSSSEPLRLRRGEPLDPQPLALVALDEARRIDGSVVGPSAQPIASAQLFFTGAFGSSAGPDGWRGAQADADGRFTLHVPRGASVQVVARDPSDQLAPTGVEAAADPGQELVLELEDASWAALHAAGPGGIPLAGVEVLAHRGEPDHPASMTITQAADSALRVPVWDEATWLRVRADGYADLHLGPFEPHAAASAVLAAELTPTAWVRGRLTAEGDAPLDGAAIRLVPLAGAGAGTGRGALAGTLAAGTGSPAGTVVGYTDAEGRYGLPVHASGAYALFVQSEGYGTATGVPASLDATADSELDVDVPATGALQGSVRTLPGGRGDDVTVVVTAADGRVHTRTADAGGGFRFEGLAPGTWTVHALRGTAAAGVPATSAVGGTVVQTVESGATAFVDVE